MIISKKVLKLSIAILFMAILCNATFATDISAGVAALQRHDYATAIKFLRNERDNYPKESQNYQDFTLYLVEALIANKQFSLAQDELRKIGHNNSTIEVEILQTIIEINLTGEQAKIDSLNNLLLSNKLNQKELVLANKFYLPILLEKNKTEEALSLIQKIDINNINDFILKANLTIEEIKLLIALEQYEKAEQKIANLDNLADVNGYLNFNLAEIKELLTLFLMTKKGDFEFYKANRSKYNSRNSLLQSVDEEALKNLTDKKLLNDDYYLVLKYAESSFVNIPNKKHSAIINNIITYELENKLEEQAINSIDMLLEYYPKYENRANLLGEKAKIYLNHKDLKSAIKVYNQIIRDDNLKSTERIIAAELSAQLYMDMGDYEHALTLYDFIIKHSKSSEEISRINMLISIYYFGESNYFLALNYLKKVKKDSSYYQDVLFLIVQCNINLGNYRDAEANLNELKILVPITNLEKYNLISYFEAKLFEKLKKNSEALTIYDRLGMLEESNFIYAPNALLKAAELYYQSNNFATAGDKYKLFSENFAKNSAEPIALYKAVYIYLLAQNEKTSLDCLKSLVDKYPHSPYATRAILHIVDFYRNSNRFEEALSQIETVQQLVDKNNIEMLSQIGYDKAAIYNDSQRYSKALEELDSNIKNYPESAIIADNYFLAGSISTEIGENVNAIDYFEKAKNARKDIDFQNIVSGRIADNYFILYSKRSDSDKLNKAIEIYDNLANDSNNSIFLRTQCFFKLGRAYELKNQLQNALNAYNEALYIGLSAADNKVKLPLIWVNKSGTNAIKINLNSGGKNYYRDSINILNRLKELNGNDTIEINYLKKIIQDKVNSKKTIL